MPVSPAIGGTTATASSPALRATALLTPDAAPACSVGAAASTVEVSGATSVVIPSPKTTTAGSTSVAYEASAPIRSMSSRPPAATSGPAVICSRGPIRSASAPDRADRASMISVNGSSEAPAASGLKPATTCSCRTSRNSTAPSAPYTTKVTMLATVNCRDRNRPVGTSGCSLVRSTQTNPASASTPSTPVATTVGSAPCSPPAIDA